MSYHLFAGYFVKIDAGKQKLFKNLWMYRLVMLSTFLWPTQQK